MTIGICDDEKVFRELLRDYCSKYGLESKININVVEFSSGEEVIAYNSNIDLLFLDINLPGKNGIEVKNNLLKKENYKLIIFVSGLTNYVWESFSKKTLGFIEKPFIYENICEKFKEYKKAMKTDITIDISTGNKLSTVKVNNIMYIKAQNVYIEIIVEKEVYLVRGSLNEWESRLREHSFARIHKSNLINLDYIKRIEGYQVTMDDGTKLKIGRTKLSTLKKEYHDYCKENAR